MGPEGAGGMESFCPGQGGSATGHRSHPLTLPVLAAQSPVGLEHDVEEGRGMGLARYCGVWESPKRWGARVMQSYRETESTQAGRGHGTRGAIGRCWCSCWFSCRGL